MTTAAKSHNVCAACRARKKKCDGNRPACASCLKRGVLCLYGTTAPLCTDPSLGMANWMPVPGMDACAWTAAETSGYPGEDWTSLINGWTPSEDQLQQQKTSMQTSSSSQRDFSTPRDSASPSDVDATLPPREQLLELVQIYFERYYHYLPLLHKRTILAKVESDDTNDCHLLLLSIISVTAGAHPNRQIQQCQTSWLNAAKEMFHRKILCEDDPLQTLQAASFIIFQTMIITDFSTSWMMLGEAWRKAVAIGSNILDGKSGYTMPGLGVRPCKDWIEEEEGRRAVWMLFMYDRGMCFPIGLTTAIDDRRLHINLPMSDDAFQSSEPPSEPPILYSPNLDRLITSIQQAERKGSAHILQYIVLGFLFLGRACEVIYGFEDSFEDQKPQVDALTAQLLRIRLMLPISVTDLSAADYRDYSYVVWLNCILNVGAIFLYHRPLGPDETLNETCNLAKSWPHCLAAARSTVAMIRNAARISPDIIHNPHFASMLFTSGRILVIEYTSPTTATQRAKDDTLREDIELLIVTFERLKEALKMVGKKYRNGLFWYLREGKDVALESKATGARGLLRTCKKWPTSEDSQDLDFIF